MKKLLLKRILPFMMAMIMLASVCLPVGAFTISAPDQADTEDTCYTVEFKNGILQVKLNPQKVYDALADGALTREELLQFVPEDVLKTLEGGAPSLDDLRALAAQYLSAEDFEELIALLPTDILTKYFMNIEFMEGLITLDEVLSMVSVDALLSEVKDEAAFNAELNALLTPLLDDLLTDKVRNELLANDAFIKNILTGAVDQIMAERRDEVMAVLPELVTEDVVHAILTNSAYTDSLVDLVIGDPDLLNQIMDDPNLTHKLALYLEDPANHDNAEALLKDAAIVAELKAHPEWITGLINAAAIQYLFDENKLTGDELVAVFGEDFLAELIAADDYALLDELMGDDALIADVVASPAFQGMAAAVMTDGLFNTLMNTPGFDIESYVTLDDAFASRFGITYENLKAKGYLLADDGTIAGAILSGELSNPPTFGELADKNYIDVNGILNDADYNITASTLGLTPAQLQTVASDMLAIPAAKAEIKAAFSAQVKAGAVDPLDFLDYVDFAEVATTSSLNVADMVFAQLNGRPDQHDVIESLLAAAELTDNDYKELFTLLGYDEILVVLEDHLDEMLADIGLAPVLAHFPALELLDALFTTPEQHGLIYLLTTETADPDDAPGTMLISYDDVLVAIGAADLPAGTEEEQYAAGISTLVGLLDAAAVSEHLGDLILDYVSFDEIVESVGGYDTVLTWYTPAELNALMGKVSYSELVTLFKNSGLLESAAFRQLGKDLFNKIRSDTERLKSFIKSFKEPLIRIVMEEITSMEINGVEFFKNGRLDLQTALVELLQSIPDVADFVAMSEGDTFFGLSLTVTFRNGDAPLTLGVDVSFDGDFTKLQELAAQNEDLFVFDVTDDMDVSVSAKLPSKVAELYARVLESDRLPAALKSKLLMLPASTLPEAVDILADLTDEEVEQLTSAVNEKIDAVLNKAENVVNRLPDQVADRVDAILLKLRDPETFRKVMDKAATLMDKLPEKAKTLTIDTLYQGSGLFVIDPIEVSVDLADRISQLSALPAGLLDTEISGSFTADVAISGLYRLTLVDEEGDRTAFFLPAGTDLSILSSIDGLDLTVWDGELPAVMPAADTEVTPAATEAYYYVTFSVKNPGSTTTTPIETVKVMATDTELTLPTAAALRGYDAVAPSDEAIAKVLADKVNAELVFTYTATEYELVFDRLTEADAVLTYTVESVIDTALGTVDGIAIPALTPNTVTDTYGWTLNGSAWTLSDLVALIESAVNTLGDLTLVETATTTTFDVTFYDHEGTVIGVKTYSAAGWTDATQYFPFLPAAGDGYTNRWVDADGNDWVDPDGNPWTEDSFDPTGVLADIDIYEERTPIIGSLKFEYYGSGDVTADFNIDTDLDGFHALLPANTASDPINAYTYYWAAPEGFESLDAFFASIMGDLDALEQTYTIKEERNTENYRITLKAADGSTVDTVLFNVESTWATLKAEFEYANKAYTFKWQDATGADWDGETFFANPVYADFTLTAAVAQTNSYDMSVTLPGSSEPVKIPYDISTGRDDFLTNFKTELLNTLPTGVTDVFKAYKLEWQNPVTLEWEEWTNTELEQFATDLYGAPTTLLSTATIADGDMDKLGDYNLRVSLREYTVTFKYYTNATTDAAVTTVEVKYTVNGLVAGNTVPTGNTENDRYTYAWKKDGAAWSAIDYTDPADYTVTEERVAKTYTYTFVPFGAAAGIEIEYTAETTAPQFAEKFNTLVPALNVSTDPKYRYEWQTAAGVAWTLADFVPGTVANVTLTEQYVSAVYVITFDMANGDDVEIWYTADGLVAGHDTWPTLSSDTAAYTYKWQKNGADWQMSDFNIADLASYTIIEAKTAVEYKYTFIPVMGQPVEVPYTIETLKATFASSIPAFTVTPAPAVGYEYVWQKADGSMWTVADFADGDETKLANVTLTETSVPQIFTITFDMREGDDQTVQYNFNGLLSGQSWPTAEGTKAYESAWEKDGNAWTTADFDPTVGGDFTVVEVLGAAKEYTYTFKWANGDPDTVVTYTIETLKATFTAAAPDATATNKAYKNHKWTLNGSTWTESSFVAGDINSLGNYTIVETREAQVYTITFKKFKNTNLYATSTTQIKVKYTVEGITEDSATAEWPENNPANELFTYKWQKGGVDWTLDLTDIDSLGTYTVDEVRTGVVTYTWTFYPIESIGPDGEVIYGDPVEVDYHIGQKPSTIEIPDLSTDSENVYTYAWYEQDGDDANGYEQNTTWSAPSNFKEGNYGNAVIREVRKVHKNNKLTFYAEDGTTVLATYYYDKTTLYVRDAEGKETAVSPDFVLASLAPDVFGKTFDHWEYKVKPSGAADKTFTLANFRTDIGGTYGSVLNNTLNINAAYALTPYTLTFQRLDPTQPGAGVYLPDDTVITYYVTTDPADLIAQINALLSTSNAAYSYSWQNAYGGRWIPETLSPSTSLENLTIKEIEKLNEYVVTFVRADGITVKHLKLTYETLKSQFEADMLAADLIHTPNPSFDRSWTYNDAAWSYESLFDADFGTVLSMDILKDYRIVEEEVAHAFLLTFYDMDGNWITNVLYNGYGIVSGEMPELPSSATGYQYSWMLADGTAWDGFDPMAAAHLDLTLTRAPIVYSITFKVEGRPDTNVTYTVLDHSFEIPTVTANPGYEVVWFYEDGETSWTKDQLSVGDLVLTARQVPLNYTVLFHDEDGSLIQTFTMTVEKKANPSAPPKPGFFGVWYVRLGDEPAETDPKWTDYVLSSGGQTVYAYVRFTSLPYQVTFMVDGEFFTARTYALDGEWTPIEAPAKAGYDAKWYIADGSRMIPWEDYDLSSGGSNLVAYLTYEAIEYQAKFYIGEELVATKTFTVEDTTIANLPEIPAKTGYTGTWEYTIGASDMDVYAVYTPIEYTATLYADGNKVAEVTFTVEDTTIPNLPAVPAKAGYTGTWEYTIGASDMDVHAVYTLIEYTADLYIDGEKVGSVTFTVEDEALTGLPEIPAKTGYTGTWEYTIGASDMDVHAVYTPIEYTADLYIDGEKVGSVTFTVEDETIPNLPELPAKTGYTGAWEYTIGASDMDVHAVYTPIEYTATFYADGVLVGTATFTVEDDVISLLPTAPAKKGYNVSWEYTIGAADMDVHATYTAIKYEAKFYADGVLVGTTTFTAEDDKLSYIPAVPEKEGYTGEWASYTLDAQDLEIHAVYTEADPFDGNRFLIFIDRFVGGLHDNDSTGLHWIWWLIILLLIILAVLTLILIFVVLKKEDEDETDPEPEPEAEPEPEDEPTPEPEPIVIPEPVESVDVETADSLMEDATAMAVLETVGGAKASGMKAIVNIDSINESFEANETVDLESLKAKKMIPAKAERIKVLANGHLDKPLTVVADSFSVQAIKMITLTGGKAVQKKV